MFSIEKDINDESILSTMQASDALGLDGKDDNNNVAGNKYLEALHLIRKLRKENVRLKDIVIKNLLGEK